jgi:hypothetical protein
MVDDGWTQTLLAPNFRVQDWFAVRDRLNPQKYDAQWRRVLGQMAARFNERFVGPADALIRRDKRFRRVPTGPGFAVLALDCILIETLFGYERGARTELGETGGAFIAFLKTQTGFEKGDRAASFARAVRNGVIHDGETRDGWTVWKAVHW